MNGLKELLSDDHGRWDIGYVSLAALVLLILGSIPVIVSEAIVQAIYAKDHVFPFADMGKAIGMITAAFGSPLLALAGYVVALKRATAPLPADAVPAAPAAP